jgi:hypothetical protein
VKGISPAAWRTLVFFAVTGILAIGLSLASPHDMAARSLFQSPLPTPTFTETVPVEPTLPAPPEVPTQAPPPEEAVSPVPVPTESSNLPTEIPNLPAPPKAPGFLPAPTLSAPNPGMLATLLPGPQQPLVAPGLATPTPRSTPTDIPEGGDAMGVAQLIDNGVIALSYAWMWCCGVLGLVVATLVFVWLARRSRRR